jgi:hypothetical protein
MEIAQKKKLVLRKFKINVFDIMQGVAIPIFVKTGKKKQQNYKVFNLIYMVKRDLNMILK